MKGVVLPVLILFCLSLCRLEKLGALEWNKIVHENEGWRLFSCMWLHAGVIHLLANMLSLVFIGIRLEQQFGFGMLCSFLSIFLPDSINFLGKNLIYKYLY